MQKNCQTQTNAPKRVFKPYFLFGSRNLICIPRVAEIISLRKHMLSLLNLATGSVSNITQVIYMETRAGIKSQQILTHSTSADTDFISANNHKPKYVTPQRGADTGIAPISLSRNGLLQRPHQQSNLPSPQLSSTFQVEGSTTTGTLPQPPPSSAGAHKHGGHTGSSSCSCSTLQVYSSPIQVYFQ